MEKKYYAVTFECFGEPAHIDMYYTDKKFVQYLEESFTINDDEYRILDFDNLYSLEAYCNLQVNVFDVSVTNYIGKVLEFSI